MESVFNDAYAILFSDMLWVLFELSWLFEAIQMSSHHIRFYKEVDKNTLAII